MIDYVRISFIVPIFVLVIACAYFMNLSTAQATKRAKEVGLRKAIGAVPCQLFRQFMGESVVTVLISSVVAVLASLLLIPILNDITGKGFSLNHLGYKILSIFAAIVIFTAIVAGVILQFLSQHSNLLKF